MKTIIYAGGSYLTGDDIAAALLEYSKGLADQDAAETIEIPVRNDDGSVGAATFLVGPSSQIVAQDAVSDLEELRDEEAVARLRRQTEALHLVARPQSAPEATSWADDDLAL